MNFDTMNAILVTKIFPFFFCSHFFTGEDLALALSAQNNPFTRSPLFLWSFCACSLGYYFFSLTSFFILCVFFPFFPHVRARPTTSPARTFSIFRSYGNRLILFNIQDEFKLFKHTFKITKCIVLIIYDISRSQEIVWKILVAFFYFF